MTLQKRIELLMEQQKISKSELARRINKPYTTVDNWFKRNSTPNSEIIEKIAIALNTTIEWLLTGNESPPKQITADKQKLLDYYEKCNQDGKNRIMEHAEFIASKYPQQGKSSEFKIG